MRKSLISAMVAVSIALAGCAEDITVINSNNKRVTVSSYGLLNESTDKWEGVCYSMVAGNVIWSIILIETVIFPVYFIGFSLYEPVGIRDNEGRCN